MVNLSSDNPAEIWSGWGGRAAWDVGANIGQSIPRLLETFEQIECFEPSTESFAAMALDWVDNPRVRLHRVALSDHDGVIDASVREVSIQTGQLVAAGMGYGDYVPGVSSAQEVSLPWGKEIGTRTVLCRSVDSLVRSYGIPDMLNIDTEGHEAQILAGAKDVLQFGKTGWVIEFHSKINYQACIDILEEAGYKPETIRHPHYKTQSKLWYEHGWIKAAPKE
jgi:FkbM family methyltransferase